MYRVSPLICKCLQWLANVIDLPEETYCKIDRIHFVGASYLWRSRWKRVEHTIVPCSCIQKNIILGHAVVKILLFAAIVAASLGIHSEKQVVWFDIEK
jgi:hypothetical protein